MSTLRDKVVVIYDPIRSIEWSYEPERSVLAEHGIRLVIPDDRAAAQAALPEADVVIVSTAIPGEDLELLTLRCRGIVCYSVGMDGVPAERARELNIPVTNVAGYCTEDVADHAIALMLAAQRELLHFATTSAAGDWDARNQPQLYRIRRLSTQTVGVIGVGRIGSTVAQKARGLGMATVGFDPFVTPTAHADMRMVSMDQLLAQSDVVILCCLLNEQTRHIIDAEALAKMRPGSILVNVARGGLVDEEALIAALHDGPLRSAALDVREVEPARATGDPMLEVPNVLLTQHVGATSVEAWEDIHRIASERVLELLSAKREDAA